MSIKRFYFSNDCTVLVTGGAGFIGSNLCEALLKKGVYVRCMDNLSTGHMSNIQDFLSHPNFTFYQFDIRDFDSCDKVTKNVDYVFHEAALGSVPRSIEMPLLYTDVNDRGTLNMMEASRKNKVKKFVYASSSSVYGDSITLPKKEGEEGKTLSPYAATKRMTEEYGRLYHDLYGLNTYGLRYFNVFGPRQDPDGPYAAVIPKFIQQIMKGERPTIYGDGRQSRDFTYIDNVVEGNFCACFSEDIAAGKVYNIGAGGREYLLDMYDVLCDLLDVQIRPLFSDSRKGDIRDSNADISKAKKYLGYVPVCNFHDGMRITVQWYLDRWNQKNGTFSFK